MTALVVGASLLAGVSTSAAGNDPLAQARQLLGRGRPSRAAAVLLEASPCSAQQRTARCDELLYWAGEALWRSGQRSAALWRMARVAAGGGARFVAAATRLTQSGELPIFGVADARRWLKLPLRRLPKSVRRQLLQRVGSAALRRNQLAEAEQLLQAAGSPRASYLRGVIALRRGSPASAARLFAASEAGALRAARSCRQQRDRRRWRELADLSALARGRISDEVADAKKHYLRVGAASPWFFRARQELAWHLLSEKNPSEALLQSLVLAGAGLRELYYRPDAEVVEAAALLALGRTADARGRAEAGQIALTEVVENLASFLRLRAEVRLYYINATESIARRTRDLSPQIKKSLLADPSFRRAVLVLRQLQRERGRLFHGDPTLRRLLGGELDERLVRWQQRAGEMVRRLLVALGEELQLLRLRCREVLFESSAKRRRTCRPLSPRGAAGGGVTWPFDGEVWPDELPYYRPSWSFCAPSSPPKP